MVIILPGLPVTGTDFVVYLNAVRLRSRDTSLPPVAFRIHA